MKKGTAVVTGGASGIGRAIAAALKKAGATVVVGDLKPSPDQGIHSVTCDVTKYEDMQSLLKAAEKHGPLSVWVNNAGLETEGGSRPFGKKAMDPAFRAAWTKMIGVNLTAVVDGTRLAVSHMVSNDGGHVINVSSISAFFPMPYSPVYSATKAAVNQLTRSTGEFLGHDSKVRVHAVCPSVTDTPLIVGHPGIDEFVKSNGGRLLTAEDVSDGVMELILAGRALPNGSAMRVRVGRQGETLRDIFKYPKAFGGTVPAAGGGGATP